MSVNRTLLREEIMRPEGLANVSVGEVLNAVIVRSGTGDYQLKVSGAGGGGGDMSGVEERLDTMLNERGGLVPERFSSVTQTLPAPASNVEEYVYALVPTGTATVTVTYEDATKSTVVSAVRS